MSEYLVREPRDEDWPAILSLANAKCRSEFRGGVGCAPRRCGRVRIVRADSDRTSQGRTNEIVVAEAGNPNKENCLGYKRADRAGSDASRGRAVPRRVFVVTAPDARGECSSASLLELALGAACDMSATARAVHGVCSGRRLHRIPSAARVLKKTDGFASPTSAESIG